MIKREKENYVIQSVSHAIDLLEQFQRDEIEVSMSDLSRNLKISKNNVFRLLATLQSRSYIERDINSGLYRLGVKILDLAQDVVRQSGHLNNARQVMDALVKECNETVCVSIMRDFFTVNMDSVECDHALRVIPRIGVQLPAYCTAAGKVQIAHYAEEKLGTYFTENTFQQYTQHTITKPELLWKHLQQIARQGYSVEHEEMVMGVKCVGAPLRDYSSKIIGAITMIGPTQRFNDARMENELIPLVVKGAANISATLGYN